MSVKAYPELVSPFNQSKVLLHSDKILQVLEGKIPSPVTVEIDLADGFCNNKCSFCFFGTDHKKEPVFIKTEAIKNIISELSSIGTKGVEFVGGGEPTTHPQIAEVISHTIDQGLDAGIVTNGLLLHKIFDVVRRLTYIRVSLDAASPEVYSKTHGVDGKLFNKVINNIKQVVSLTGQNTVGVGFLVVPENIDDIIPAAKLVKNLGVRHLQFRPATYSTESTKPVNLDQLVIEAQNRVKEAVNIFADESFQIFDAGVKWRHINRPRYYNKCNSSTFCAVIKANGDIPYCILKRNKQEELLGNIYTKSFSDIWFSKRHEELISINDLSKCPKPCKHDSYNIITEAIQENLLHQNFL